LKRTRKHIFLYGSILFTYCWILLGPSSLHFRIARQGHYSLSPSPFLWGPLESARADNNSYMSQQVAIPGPLTGSPALWVSIAFPYLMFFLVSPLPLSFGVFCLSLMHVRWPSFRFLRFPLTVLVALREKLYLLEIIR